MSELEYSGAILVPETRSEGLVVGELSLEDALEDKDNIFVCWLFGDDEDLKPSVIPRHYKAPIKHLLQIKKRFIEVFKPSWEKDVLEYFMLSNWAWFQDKTGKFYICSDTAFKTQL